MLEIHEEKPIAPEAIPEGSRFKGHEDYVVQDLIIRAHNMRYRLERWQTPEGDTLMGQLPRRSKVSILVRCSGAIFCISIIMPTSPNRCF